MKFLCCELLLLIGSTCFGILLCLHDVDVNIQELEELNATCDRNPCPKQYESNYECNCGPTCVQHGTCCLDSSHIFSPKPRVKPACRDLGPSSYLLVDKCPDDRGQDNSAFEDLCQSEWDGENDVMRLIPVTSIFTQISYKNYFCFRCHESHNDYVFWSISISSQYGEVDLEKVEVQLIYDNYYETWAVPVEDDHNVSVTISIVRPISLASITKPCSSKIISVCSEVWSDDEIRGKCNAYMYLTTIKRDNRTFYYKNPHCALCNNETLSDKSCEFFTVPVVSYGIAAKKPFSFTYLLDINRSDGEKVGKTQRCMNNDVWDPFFERCRTLTCAKSTHSVQDGKCVATS